MIAAVERLCEKGALSDAPDAGTSISRAAQSRWSATPLQDRLKILRSARYRMAELTNAFTDAISPELARTPADTRIAEILPLLAVGQFLEDRAEALLAPRKLGHRGLPFWLAGVSSEVHRVALGHVLVIGPANYPLFLPGVQVLQALAAGNTVTWKPGRGGRAVAELVAGAMRFAGVPEGVLRVTGETIEAGEEAMRGGADKVFFTGSATTGRLLMRQLAETLTPSVMELSGCDAVIVLPSGSLSRAVQALAFGMRLNGSATCMAPRRVLLVDATRQRRDEFLQELRGALGHIRGVPLTGSTRALLHTLLREATDEGADVEGDPDAPLLRPILVTGVQSTMRLVQADLFAPVLSVLEVAGQAGVIAAQEACSYGLTASIFGEEQEARRLAAKLIVGTVLINDLIVPTADPRVPFGGRRGSGFGVTRGAEGLLEMTAIKVVAVRRGQSTRHYEETTSAHEPLFDGIIQASHGRGWRERLGGWKQVAAAGKNLSKKKQ